MKNTPPNKSYVTETSYPIWLVSLATCIVSFVLGGKEAIPEEAATTFLCAFLFWSQRKIYHERVKRWKTQNGELNG